MTTLIPHRGMRRGVGLPLVFGILLVAALVVLGCGSSTGTSAPPTTPYGYGGGSVGTNPNPPTNTGATTAAPGAAATAATITGHAFSPQNVTVPQNVTAKVGGAVTWATVSVR